MGELNKIEIRSGFMYEYDKTMNAYKPYFLKVRAEDIIGTVRSSGVGGAGTTPSNIAIEDVTGLKEKLDALGAPPNIPGYHIATESEKTEVEKFMKRLMMSTTKYNPKKVDVGNLRYQIYNKYGICNLDFISGTHVAIYNIPVRDFFTYINTRRIDIKFDGIMAAMAFAPGESTYYTVTTGLTTTVSSALKNYTITHTGTDQDMGRATFTIYTADALFSHIKTDSLYDDTTLTVEYKAISKVA